VIDAAAATDGASFLYPALTDEERQNTHQLVEVYRRAMGRTRVLALVAGVAVLSWGIWHSRRDAQHKPGRRVRRHHRA
jgi:hypothetical protein